MAGAYLVPASIYRGMEGQALAFPDTETGGTKLGVRQGDDFIDVFNIPAGPAARRSSVRYSPDTAWQQAVVDVLTQRLPHLIYISDWHTHPAHFDRPSQHDLRTAMAIVTDEVWNSPAAVFPIGVHDRGRVRFRAYLMRRETLTFSEIPLVVVDDHDPRVTAALTGMDATIRETAHVASEVHDARRDPGGRRSGGIFRWFASSLRTRPTR